MLCKILAFFILPCLVVSFKMDMKPAFEGYSADLTDAIHANNEKTVEINGHPIQAKSLEIVTSESSDRNQCQDKASGCPAWTWYCTNNQWKDWMAQTCPKSCGLCSGSGQTCSTIPSWMKNTINSDGKIVGGLTAPLPIPWQVQVRVNFNNLGQYMLCGGTILDEETILCAAHCFVHKATGASISLKNNDVIVAGSKNSNNAGPQAQMIRIKKFTNHPSYNHATLAFDYSIVKLASPLSFNTNVRPACLPTANFVPGNVALASGWGSIKNYAGPSSQSLRYVALPLLQGQCGSKHLCAGGSDGKGICAGDSGGPLVVPRSQSDDTAVVVGISSWVTWEDADKNCKMSFFASVSAELGWIKATSGVA